MSVMETEKNITEAMEKAGWTRQFIANEPRLTEAVSMYKETGFEVTLRDVPPADTPAGNTACGSGADCRTCFEGLEHLYKMIFTRPLQNSDQILQEDLV
jgi:hypothetical protein